MNNTQKPIHVLSSHLHFLSVCCKSNPSMEEIHFIHASISEEPIDLLTLVAYEHGILPLVYKGIKKLLKHENKHSTLHTFYIALKPYYIEVSKRNMLMSAELISIITLLSKYNIEAISFKGPTLSQIAYGDITLRQYGDLDMLIRPYDFMQVLALLRKKSYASKYDYEKSVEKVLELIPDHMFVNSSNQIPIEIHNKLFASNFPIQVKDSIFWDHSISITINNKTIRTFKEEYLLFYLCLHGGKHLFSRISWILDIAMLIDSSSENFDWKQFKQIGEEYHLDTMICVGLHLAHILYQSRIPNHVLKEINANKKSLKLAISILHNISESPEDTERFTLTHLKMFDSWSEKIKYSFYLFKPTVLDYQNIHKVFQFDLFHYTIRPFKIIYRIILNKST